MIPSGTTAKIITALLFLIVATIAVPLILVRTQGLPPIWPVLGVLFTIVISSVLLAPYLASKKSQKMPRSYPPQVYETDVDSPVSVAEVFQRIEDLFTTRRDISIQRQDYELKVHLGSDYKLRMHGVFSSSGRDALPVTATVQAVETEYGSHLHISCTDNLGWFVGKQGKQMMETTEQCVRETARQIADVATRKTSKA